MRILAILLLSVSFQAVAQTGECVPSMSVEKAQAVYQEGLAQISKNLEAGYSQASAVYNQSVSESQELHRQKLSEAESRYQAELKAIQGELGPEWREQFLAAVERHNQSVQAATQELQAANLEQLRIYDESTKAAAQAYNQRALELTETYNKSVCAVKK